MDLPAFGPAPTPAPMFPNAFRAAAWRTVPTDQPVAFLTIDDGYDHGQDNPVLAAFVAEHQIPLTCFVTFYAASQWPPTPGDPHVAYLRQYVTGGRRVGSHAKSHVSLPTLVPTEQLASLQKAHDWLGRTDMFGQTPVLFRPPYGDYDGDTLRAARTVGHEVAVLWSLTPPEIAAGAQVRRGDIILLHFDGNLETDLLAALEAIAAAGLTPAWLEDWVR